MSNSGDCYRFDPCEKTKSNIDYRTDFDRDYGRVIHSPSFRRLDGKTQLFPSQEIDFFRNRLTHSLEVAQIAKSIARRLLAQNSKLPLFPEVCEIAGLLHDIGHPPFGHNGEAALDECMVTSGGFEGNAQSLRIITRLEKKDLPADGIVIDDEGRDKRTGLNLTARVIASVIKYDRPIPSFRKKGAAVFKGYYESEKEIVSTVKKEVAGDDKISNFKTIECWIMDLADDIAYSTYDIEDAFKGEFLTPFSMLSADDGMYTHIVKDLKDAGVDTTVEECRGEVFAIFADVWKKPIQAQKAIDPNDPAYSTRSIANFLDSYRVSRQLANNGYYRTLFTSRLVNDFINGVEIEINTSYPQLSRAYFKKEVLTKVTILKYFAFSSIIDSSRLKVAENRGYEIVQKIFYKLTSDNGSAYLPSDFQALYRLLRTDASKIRLISDFIAGMTDRYALEFYERLFSENPQTIYKPLY